MKSVWETWILTIRPCILKIKSFGVTKPLYQIEQNLSQSKPVHTLTNHWTLLRIGATLAYNHSRILSDLKGVWFINVKFVETVHKRGAYQDSLWTWSILRQLINVNLIEAVYKREAYWDSLWMWSILRQFMNVNLIEAVYKREAYQDTPVQPLYGRHIIKSASLRVSFTSIINKKSQDQSIPNTWLQFENTITIISFINFMNLQVFKRHRDMCTYLVCDKAGKIYCSRASLNSSFVTRITTQVVVRVSHLSIHSRSNCQTNYVQTFACESQRHRGQALSIFAYLHLVISDFVN